MTPSDFVDVIKSEVRDAAAADTLSQVRSPSGRRPPEHLRRLSVWFNQLSEADQQCVADMVAMSAHNAVFGFLCVLDGVRAIEDGEQHGELQLTYSRPGEVTVALNTATGDPLHDMLNAV